jgi:hypothetical protein
MIRQKILFNNPFPEEVDETSAAEWIHAHRLWKCDGTVPQQLALEPVAYANAFDFVWYQC